MNLKAKLPNINSGLKRVGLIVVGVLLTLAIWSLSHRQAPIWADSPNVEISIARSQPFWVQSDAGTTWNIFGLEIVGKVMSQQTDGAYAVVFSTTPPEGGPPLHVHEHEDELFYVVKGTYEFRFGDETVIANPGDLVHLPAHIPHRFRNIGTEPGVTMNTITPGGVEQFFAEIDQLPKDQPPNREQVAEIASHYGLRFLPDPA